MMTGELSKSSSIGMGVVCIVVISVGVVGTGVVIIGIGINTSRMISSFDGKGTATRSDFSEKATGLGINTFRKSMPDGNSGGCT